MISAKHIVFPLIAFMAGCAPPADPMNETPDDFEPYVVQAAAHVERTDTKLNVQQVLDGILRSLGCQSDGGSYLADGTPASVSYNELPYLMIGVLLTGDEQLDVRMYYNRNRKDELEEWITRFKAAVENTAGLSCDVYEEPSTGPF